ncbi:MAG: sigma-70 family RNA polymerase sigma factor, partial [bacterium]|nr:sigma-70 family RNA polymerase sigma factor [bacterium]
MTDDEKIIELFFARSEQAIREIDGKYGAICRGLSYNIVNSRQDAEECVNDAYLGAWNAIPPARPDPLLAWLCKIVRNISLKSYYRKVAAKRGSRHAVVLEEIEGCLADPNTVESEIEARELARVIEQFLDTLTAENRVIFMRRYWFCDSCREIAGFTGLTEKNISVRLTRIRQKLKAYLSESLLIKSQALFKKICELI